MPNEFRGRLPGESVIYSVEQTERYKSQWMRYQGAQKLLKNRDLIFDNGEIRRFRSKRSPVGYWEVSKGSGINAQWFGPIYGDGIPIGHSFNNGNLRLNYRGTDAQTPEIFTVVYHGIFDKPANLDSLKFTAIVRNSSAPGTPFGGISCSGEWGAGLYTGQELSDVIAVENSFVLINVENDPSKTDVFYGTRTEPYTQLTGREFTVEEDEFILPEGQILLGVRCTIGNKGFIAEIDGWNDGEFNIFIDLKIEGIATRQCTCPDWQKKAKALVDSRYLSEHIDRNWTESDAGAPDPPRECKHMIAAAIIDKTYEIPVDIRAKLTATEIKSLRPSGKPLKVNSQIKPIKLLEQKLPTLKPRKQRDLIPITESVDLGQEIWTGEKRTGVYKGSQRDIDLGEDIDTLPEYEEYLVDRQTRENIDNSIKP